MKNDKGFSAVVMLLVIITITVIGFAGWYVWSSNNKEVVLNSYEECATQEGAIIQESYPEVCVYKDQRFVNPNQTIDPDANQTAQDDNKKYLEIKEWGVKIPLSDETKDIELGEFKYDTFLAEAPDTHTVRVSSSVAPEGCRLSDTYGYGVGVIVKSKKNIGDSSDAAYVDGYYYFFYGGNDATCGTANDTTESAVKKKASVTGPIIETIKNIESL